MRRLVFLLLCHAAAAIPLPTFYMYEGEAFSRATTKLLTCYAKEHLRAPWDDSYLLAEHMTEIWVHRALIHHPQRTYDPANASLFYVPTYMALSHYESGNWTCGGGTHLGRISGVIEALRKSPWFQRRGGADHMMVCAYIHCAEALTGKQRQFLGRVIMGNMEPSHYHWTQWGCGNRVVAVPYAARSDIWKADAKVPPSKRAKLFFFHGSGRRHSGRDNLIAAALAFPKRSDIVVTSAAHPLVSKSSKVDESYAHAITNSRLCWAPRGDTQTSRRIYDSVSAGCIPIISKDVESLGDLAFSDVIPYEEFSFFLDSTYLESRENVAAAARMLANVSDERLDEMHAQLLRWRSHIVVSANKQSSPVSGSFSHLPASTNLATEFLIVSWSVFNTKPWACRWLGLEMHVEEHESLLKSMVYPATGRADEWLAADEIKIFPESDLLLCSVPGAGAEPLEAVLALTGQPPVTLNMTNATAYREAFSLERQQLRVVRDPVIRLLALFLEGRRAAVLPAAVPSSDADAASRNVSGPFLTVTAKAAENLGPAFRALVGELERLARDAELAEHPVFRQQSGFCGARYWQYSSVLRRETLVRDGESLLRSLNLWERSGWSDALKSANGSNDTPQDAAAGPTALSAAVDAQRAAAAFMAGDKSWEDEMFGGCDWAHFYDEKTLDLVPKLYAEDYRKMPWYTAEVWRNRWHGCRATSARYQPEKRA